MPENNFKCLIQAYSADSVQGNTAADTTKPAWNLVDNTSFLAANTRENGFTTDPPLQNATSNGVRAVLPLTQRPETVMSWKASPVLSDCVGPTDAQGHLWSDPDFDESTWQIVTLPDIGSIPGEHDRFYRTNFVLSDDPSHRTRVFLSLAADDGIWVYVNGNLVEHWGGDCHDGPLAGDVHGIDITQFVVTGTNTIAAHVSNGPGGSWFWADVEIVSIPLLPAPFALSYVDITVKDIHGIPISGAHVRGISEEWGLLEPMDENAVTNENGHTTLLVPMGRWTFLAGAGDQYTGSHLGDGVFVATTREIITDTTITLQPDTVTLIEFHDLSGHPLTGTIRAVDMAHGPALHTFQSGQTQAGQLRLQMTSGFPALVGFQGLSADNKHYFLIAENISGGTTFDIRATSENTTQIRYSSIDAQGQPVPSAVHFRFDAFSTYDWVIFDIPTGYAELVVDPRAELVYYWLRKDNWWFQFLTQPVTFVPGTLVQIQVGGPLTARLHTFEWGTDTHTWVDVRDAQGHLLQTYTDPGGQTHVPITLTLDGSVIYSSDIAENEGMWEAFLVGRIPQTFDPAHSPNYEIDLNLGPLGELFLTGNLLGPDTAMIYDHLTTQHFDLAFPPGFRDQFVEIADMLESHYTAARNLAQSDVPFVIRVLFLIYQQAGWQGGDTIGLQFAYSLSSSTMYPPSAVLEVAGHELGHQFQASSAPVMYGNTIATWFGESQANLFDNEAVYRRAGPKFGLVQQGSWNNFFRALRRGETPAQVDSMTVIHFYLRRTYGLKIQQDLIQLWGYPSAPPVRKNLEEAGFTVEEAIASTYWFVKFVFVGTSA